MIGCGESVGVGGLFVLGRVERTDVGAHGWILRLTASANGDVIVGTTSGTIYFLRLSD